MIHIGLDIVGIANSVLISLLEILKVFSGPVMVFDREVYFVPMIHSMVHKLSTKYRGSQIETYSNIIPRAISVPFALNVTVNPDKQIINIVCAI